MASVPDDIPGELREAWGKLLVGRDGRKMRPHLSPLHGVITLSYGLEAALKSSFEGTRPEAVDLSTRSASRKTLVSSLQSHSLIMGAMQKTFAKLSAEGQEAIRRLLGWIAERLVQLLSEFSDFLGLENWSVAAQLASFPPGASFTITLTFK